MSYTITDEMPDTIEGMRITLFQMITQPVRMETDKDNIPPPQVARYTDIVTWWVRQEDRSHGVLTLATTYNEDAMLILAWLNERYPVEVT